MTTTDIKRTPPSTYVFIATSIVDGKQFQTRTFSKIKESELEDILKYLELYFYSVSLSAKNVLPTLIAAMSALASPLDFSTEVLAKNEEILTELMIVNRDLTVDTKLLNVRLAVIRDGKLDDNAAAIFTDGARLDVFNGASSTGGSGSGGSGSGSNVTPTVNVDGMIFTITNGVPLSPWSVVVNIPASSQHSAGAASMSGTLGPNGETTRTELDYLLADTGLFTFVFTFAGGVTVTKSLVVGNLVTPSVVVTQGLIAISGGIPNSGWSCNFNINNSMIGGGSFSSNLDSGGGQNYNLLSMTLEGLYTFVFTFDGGSIVTETLSIGAGANALWVVPTLNITSNINYERPFGEFNGPNIAQASGSITGIVVASGSLPPGMSLYVPSGPDSVLVHLVGTATASGNFSGTLSATGAFSGAQTGTFSINVEERQEHGSVTFNARGSWLAPLGVSSVTVMIKGGDGGGGDISLQSSPSPGSTYSGSGYGSAGDLVTTVFAINGSGVSDRQLSIDIGGGGGPGIDGAIVSNGGQGVELPGGDGANGGGGGGAGTTVQKYSVASVSAGGGGGGGTHRGGTGGAGNGPNGGTGGNASSGNIDGSGTPITPPGSAGVAGYVTITW